MVILFMLKSITEREDFTVDEETQPVERSHQSFLTVGTEQSISKQSH